MAAVLTQNDTLADLMKAIEKMNDEEQKFLLAQINAHSMLKKGFPKITKHPANVPMSVIDKWKHDSRKYAK